MPVRNTLSTNSERRTEWLAHCPLRDEQSPEYRLLLLTIREEITNAMTENKLVKRNLLYARMNMLLIACTIVATVLFRWH
jgi:hypothetical protein